MDDDSGLDVDFALGLGGVNLQHARIAAEALNLNDVREADALQCARKSLALFPRDQIFQDIEDKAHSVTRDRLLKIKLSAGSKTLGAVRFIGDARQDHQLHFRMPAMQH